MNIQKVGTLRNQSIRKRYFFDLTVREQIETIIQKFCDKIGYSESLSLEWRNLGSESDIYECGVALRVNKCYELRYKLISEDFNFWYYDRENPKIILEDVEPSEDMEPILFELFRCLAEDYAKLEAVKFLQNQDLPNYPGDPVRPRTLPNQDAVSEILRL